MAENDRSLHELEVLINAFEYGATVDQLSISNCVSIEILVGRV